MVRKNALIHALLLVALLVVAGAGDAKSSNAATQQKFPPEQAKAHGLVKHADPVAPPAPAPDPTPAPGQGSAPPAPAPPPSAAPPSGAPAWSPPASSAPAASLSDSVSEAPASEPATATSSDGATRSFWPTPRSIESRVDSNFAASMGGATTTRAPSWGGSGSAPAPAAGEGDAPWWLTALWALPLVGAGGVGAVVMLAKRDQKKRRAGAVTLIPAAPARIGRMTPVRPDDIKGILNNGHVAAARGAYDEAVAWFDTALGFAPKLGVAYFCKGVCLAANGRAAEAYGALRDAVEHDPADANYRVHFARVALTLGKHKEAMDALEFVARAMPELGPAMLDDPQLAGLRDHPRFLMICGAL